jgi:ribosome-binding ATPase YchF (GTP1/OBG family)
MAVAADPFVPQLCEIFRPKKVVQASLEIVDTPGLKRTHEGSSAKLAMIREVGCLVLVVAAHGGNDAKADMRNFEEDLLITDLEIVSGRIERLQDQIRKPRPNREEMQKELHVLEPLRAALDSGKHLRELQLNPEQERCIRAFQLFSQKPRLVLFNLADDETDPDRWRPTSSLGVETEAIALSLQLGLSRMSASERDEFCREMNVSYVDRDTFIRKLMRLSGQSLFFTASDKEVHTWMIRQGGTALDAAGAIHTDLARGFIRAEVMSCADLIRLGSEREVKAHNLLRQEHKDYVVQEGEILYIRHG